jgi:hypothetical protein
MGAFTGMQKYYGDYLKVIGLCEPANELVTSVTTGDELAENNFYDGHSTLKYWLDLLDKTACKVETD